MRAKKLFALLLAGSMMASVLTGCWGGKRMTRLPVRTATATSPGPIPIMTRMKMLLLQSTRLL